MPKKNKKIYRSKFQDHKRVRKELIPPFGQMEKMVQIFYHRDFLPELLWIDSLISYYGESKGLSVFSNFLDTLDCYNNSDDVLNGMISYFKLIKKSKFDEVLDELSYLIDEAVIKPFGSFLYLYPKIPLSFLKPALKSEKISRKEAIEDVKKAVVRLFPAKDDHGGMCRFFALTRYLAHGKLKTSPTMTELNDALKMYPSGDRYMVEASARNFTNIVVMQKQEENPSFFEWAEYFWNENYKLSTCEINE